MQSGIHRNLPADEVAQFRRDLLTQASADKVSLDISQTIQDDGTVTVSWQVIPASSQPAPPGIDTPSVDPPAMDGSAIVVQAQGALAGLLQATTNQVTRAVLSQQMASVGQSLGEIPPQPDQTFANVLNSVGDNLAAASDAASGSMLSPAAAKLLDARMQIGNALGSTAQIMKGGIAEPPDAAPDDAASPPPRQPKAASASTAARARAASPTAAAKAAQSLGLLRDNYVELFNSCVTSPEHVREVQAVAQRIVANAAQYHDVATALGGKIPWFLIGVIHSLESNFSFTTHLHNGNPLSARTVTAPKGRPAQGSPPFTWKASACDALTLKHLDQVDDWPLAVMLDRLERYNGVGYAARGVSSPYLWSFSQLFTKGKFVADHVFDPNAPSKQCGGGVVLKHMVDTGIITLSDPSLTPNADAALGHGVPNAPAPAAIEPASARGELTFPGELRQGSADAMGIKRVQEWCTFAKVGTPIDGDFGTATDGAVRAFQNRAGIPATGVVDLRTWSSLTAPMLAVLATPKTVPASLNAAVVAIGQQHVAQRPIELGGDNLGAWVRLYMDGHDGTEQEWCAGFACFIIAQAARLIGTAMPFPRQVGVSALIADAKASGRFISGADVPTPAARRSRLSPGCLFVIKTASQSHAGIVTAVDDTTFDTVEGNTAETSSPEAKEGRGFEAIALKRSYVDRDFILLA